MERDKPWWYPPPGPPYVVGRIDLGGTLRRVYDAGGAAGRQFQRFVKQARTGVFWDDPWPNVDAHDDAVCNEAIRDIARMFPANVERYVVFGPGHFRPVPV